LANPDLINLSVGCWAFVTGSNGALWKYYKIYLLLTMLCCITQLTKSWTIIVLTLDLLSNSWLIALLKLLALLAKELTEEQFVNLSVLDSDYEN
jgi:hypothetical protein